MSPRNLTGARSQIPIIHETSQVTAELSETSQTFGEVLEAYHQDLEHREGQTAKLSGFVEWFKMSLKAEDITTENPIDGKVLDSFDDTFLPVRLGRALRSLNSQLIYKALDLNLDEGSVSLDLLLETRGEGLGRVPVEWLGYDWDISPLKLFASNTIFELVAKMLHDDQRFEQQDSEHPFYEGATYSEEAGRAAGEILWTLYTSMPVLGDVNEVTVREYLYSRMRELDAFEQNGHIQRLLVELGKLWVQHTLDSQSEIAYRKLLAKHISAMIKYRYDRLKKSKWNPVLEQLLQYINLQDPTLDELASVYCNLGEVASPIENPTVSSISWMHQEVLDQKAPQIHLKISQYLQTVDDDIGDTADVQIFPIRTITNGNVLGLTLYILYACDTGNRAVLVPIERGLFDEQEQAHIRQVVSLDSHFMRLREEDLLNL